ncbi:MAG: hypothetical protein ACR2OM_13015 [Aestuariivirgaceae bacterium]
MYAFNPVKGLAIMLLIFIAVDYFLLGGSMLRQSLRAMGLIY